MEFLGDTPIEGLLHDPGSELQAHSQILIAYSFDAGLLGLQSTLAIACPVKNNWGTRLFESIPSMVTSSIPAAERGVRTHSGSSIV